MTARSFQRWLTPALCVGLSIAVVSSLSTAPDDVRDARRATESSTAGLDSSKPRNVEPAEVQARAQSNSAPLLTCPADFSELWAGGAATGQLAKAHTGVATYLASCARGGTHLSYTDTSVRGTTVGAPELIVTRVWRLTDDCGTNVECTQTISLLSPTGQTGALTLDALPGQCPNVVDVHGSAPTPIALVGTWLHDATAVDASSLRLSRADGVGTELALSSLPIAFQDATRPYYGAVDSCHAFGGEGHLDVVIAVPNWMMLRAFELDDLPSSSRIALRLQGRLLDGTRFDVDDEITLK